MMDIKIRPEQPSDAARIEAVTAAAFFQAPHTSHTEHFIVNALRQAGQLSVSLVAQFEDKVVGHGAASPVALSDGTPGWLGLGPLSVQPEFQGRGIGSQLMRELLRELERQCAAGCVLVGEPAFYGRFGFRAEPGLILPGVAPQYFLALPLGRSAPHGIVSFHEAFKAQA